MEMNVSKGGGDVKSPDPGEAWRARAPELARWAGDQLVNRTDRRGKYYLKDGKIRKCADPRHGARDGVIDLDRLIAHFRARTHDDVIGLFSNGPDKRGKWLAIDLDNHHHDGAVAERNLRYALHLYSHLTSLGINP